MTEKFSTMFLPAERDPDKVIVKQHKLLKKARISSLFEDFPLLMFILNSKRQIIWMNVMAMDFFHGENSLGCRPGELFSCKHSTDNIAGCGTGPFCKFCNVAKSLVMAVDECAVIDECIIERGLGVRISVLDLKIWVKSLPFLGQKFTILGVRDVTDRNRIEAVERIFYHDIGNTVIGMKSLISIMIEEKPDNTNEYQKLLLSASNQLLEEIESQKSLKAAEEGRLLVNMTTVSVHEVIDKVKAAFEYPLFGRNIHLILNEPKEDVIFECDGVLLRRILVNMVKNAIEASKSGDEVKISYSKTEYDVTLSVHNNSVVPEEIKDSIFKRSYSTKGSGRGLGTYGMRVLAQWYLGGNVNFVSSVKDGTTFILSLPLYNEH